MMPVIARSWEISYSVVQFFFGSWWVTVRLNFGYALMDPSRRGKKKVNCDRPLREVPDDTGSLFARGRSFRGNSRWKNISATASADLRVPRTRPYRVINYVGNYARVVYPATTAAARPLSAVRISRQDARLVRIEIGLALELHQVEQQRLLEQKGPRSPTGGGGFRFCVAARAHSVRTRPAPGRGQARCCARTARPVPTPAPPPRSFPAADRGASSARHRLAPSDI